MSDKPIHTAEVYRSVLESVAAAKNREIARLKVQMANLARESAGFTLRIAEIEERGCELEQAAACYVAQGKLFERFGELTDRERDIALAAAAYVFSGTTRNPRTP